MSNLAAGAIALVIVSIATFLGFTQDIPFTRPHQVKGVFESATSIRVGSPVRIAGVDVGKVAEVEGLEDSGMALVTMSIDDDGLPIHEDATAKIRPRIFLEGNFFVDLEPGSPGAPVLDDGETIKVSQTATPVQLDEVLTALQDDTREDLKSLLSELATAFDEGADDLNAAAEDAGPAFRSTAIVNEAFLGVEPDRDLQRLLAGLADASEGLAENEEQLKDLVTNLNTTMGAFATEESAVRRTIADLGPTLTRANDALASLNDAFPSTRAFAREILPGVRETPATITASFPWIAETRRLMQRSELRGLARDLSPATRDFAVFVNHGNRLMPQVRLLAECQRDVILPTGDVVIRDEFTTGVENYKEFFHTLVGLAGESQNFDGNGVYVRFQAGGGANTVSLGDAGAGGTALHGNGFPGVGTRPKRPPRNPPKVDDRPCRDQPLPDLNGPWAARGEFGRQP